MTVRQECMVVCALLFLTGGCENSLPDRSLIFATHTTLGVELAVQPTDAATAPVSMVLGYKRTEGVLNPVYHSEGIETADEKTTTSTLPGGTGSSGSGATVQPVSAAAGSSGAGTVLTSSAQGVLVQTKTEKGRRPRYREDAYSVLAKFQGEVKGQVEKAAEAGMSVAQWFATGPAATMLAGQPGIAGAISGSSKIGEAAAQEAGARRVSVQSSPQADVVISSVYSGLKELADAEDMQAKFYVAGLNTLGELAPETFEAYQRNPDKTVTSKTVDCRKTACDFNAYLIYREQLKLSIATLKEAVEAGKADLSGPLDKYKADQKKLDAAVGKCPQYMDAMEYYLSVLRGTERRSL